ncbi:unnamed protein product [Musa banksii]
MRRLVSSPHTSFYFVLTLQIICMGSTRETHHNPNTGGGGGGGSCWKQKKIHTTTRTFCTTGLSSMLSSVGFHTLAFPLSFSISRCISDNTSSSLCSPFSFR